MPSVLRRYTPPTCTLEIMATGSALSRWTDRQVLKRVKFRLRLDDPRIPIEDRITLTGDRTQLEELCQAVSSYVQTVLVMSPSPSITAMPIPALPNSASTFYLTARGVLNHTLHLGALATDETGQTISLTVTQLADLATALDAYQAEAIALPNLSRSSTGLPLGWGTIAAATVLILGTTLSLVNLWPSTVPQTASDTDNLEEAPIALDSGTAETAEPESFSSAPRDRPTAETTPIPSTPTTRDRLDRPNLDQPTNRPTNPNQTNPNQSDRPGSSPTVAPPPSVSATAPRESSETTLSQPEAQSELDSLESSVTTARQAPDRSNPDNDAANSAANGTAIAESPPAPTAAPSADLTPGTAFDRIPQVAEVRQYFQQRWAPPSDLDQALEYQLSIDASGAVQTITPLGQPSRDYIDRAELPNPGQTFVSPTTGESLRIRVLLSPEGSVQTFLESTNP